MDEILVLIEVKNGVIENVLAGRDQHKMYNQLQRARAEATPDDDVELLELTVED